MGRASRLAAGVSRHSSPGMPSAPRWRSTAEAQINITDNDFSNATVVASGSDPSATINLTNNYWGATTTSVIESKITDHHVNSNLPTVNFNPPLW